MPQPYMLVPSPGSDQADEWVRLGIESQMQAQQLPDPQQRSQKFLQAEQHYKHALRLVPRHAVATQNLAVLFAQVGNLNEGLITAERAAMFDDRLPIIHTNRAFMNLEADRIDEALDAARHAATLCRPADEHYAASRLALAMVSASAGLAPVAARAYNELLDVDPKHQMAAMNASFVQTLVDATPADLLAQRQRWYAANRYTGPVTPHDNDRTAGRRLRVGYVSGDFKMHSAAMIFGNVVLNHTDAVDVYLYSTLPVDPASDLRTRQFKEKAGERWRDITALSDDDAAAQMRRDRIDILVDLSGHTMGGRLPIFLRKPAPVQVTAWGFAHGTGCPEIDYFLADPVAVPVEERQHFAEQIYDLPCIVTYAEPKEYQLKASSLLPYFKNDEAFVTFGSYARYEKLSDQCLAVFAEIMRRVPEARLEFKDSSFRRPYSIRRVMRAMPDVAPERLLFSINTSHPDHMLAHQQADLLLDPFPHSGGVVALEQLYMGVPLLTLYGRQPGGRTASSVLTQMKRTDWIARSTDEYVAKAVELAGQPQVLSKARKTLRQELLNSPVVKDYHLAVEAAYRDMWQRWCSAPAGAREVAGDR